MADRQLREDVINTMAKVAYDATKAGVKDVHGLLKDKFPGTPFSVLMEAEVRADIQSDEEWWQMVEATIDGEAIKKAVELVAQQPTDTP